MRVLEKKRDGAAQSHVKLTCYAVEDGALKAFFGSERVAFGAQNAGSLRNRY
jgi:hypothetical protein